MFLKNKKQSVDVNLQQRIANSIKENGEPVRVYIDYGHGIEVLDHKKSKFYGNSARLRSMVRALQNL